jgi:hypothetical protein
MPSRDLPLRLAVGRHRPHLRPLQRALHLPCPSCLGQSNRPSLSAQAGVTGRASGALFAARLRCSIGRPVSKLYGDCPNELPLVKGETRLELPEEHRWYRAIGTMMSIDLSTHLLFGVSKAAGDLRVQE